MKERGCANASYAAQWVANGHGIFAPGTVEPPHSAIDVSVA